MDIEQARNIIQKTLSKKITNTMLAEALNMALPNISRKIKTGSKLKPKHVKMLEEYFKIKLISTENKKDNYDNLKELIFVVESYLESQNLYIRPQKKAELIVLLYKIYLNGELSIDKNNVINLCKLVS